MAYGLYGEYKECRNKMIGDGEEILAMESGVLE